MNIDRFALRHAPEAEAPAGGAPPPPAPVAAPPVPPPPVADAGKPALDPALISTAPPAPVAPPPAPKLGPDGKPIVEAPPAPKLGPDGKPIVEPKLDANGKPFTAETYKDIALPEHVAKDDPMLGTALSTFAKHGIDPTTAAALISDLAPELRKDARAPYEAFNELNKGWQAEIQNDPEIGGAKLDATLGRIGEVMRLYGDPGLFDKMKLGADGKPVMKDGKPIIESRGALSLTGAGNHPAVIRTLHRIALALTEGGGIGGHGESNPRSLDAVATAMYPSARKPGA